MNYHNHVLRAAGIREFIISVKTDNAGSSNDDQFTIPTSGAGYNYSVDWGDGFTDSGVAGNITHTFTGIGTFDVKITGDFPRIFFNNVDDKSKLIDIKQWGNIEWKDFTNAFYGCDLLTIISATDAPNLTGVTSMATAFRAAEILDTVDFSSWDTSNIDTMFNMFFACFLLDEPLPFETSNVTDMDNMLASCNVFNQEVNFDTGNVIDMSRMFGFSTLFNQPVLFDTIKVTDMSNMFESATNFNQDISGFDINAVTTMNAMFLNSNAWSTVNYDLALISFDGQSHQNNVPFNAGNAQFTLGGAAETAKNALVADGWTIIDGGGV